MPIHGAVAQRPSKAGPFLKWAGGKSQLLEQFRPLIPTVRRYFEPFLGGGAMFFHLAPARAVLSDCNRSLVDTYNVVRDGLDELIPWLYRYRERHCEAFYYEVRTRYNEELCASTAERAAMFIYLNRTGYNGLYRENSRGGFNVPFGRYENPRIFSEEALQAASRALHHAELRCQTYEDCVQGARRGDFVYFDPPYQPLSTTASFTAYSRLGFGEREQQRLAEVYRQLDARGCRLMLSNSDTPLIRALYQGFALHTVRATRAINSVASGRGRIQELAVLNYEVEQPAVTG